MEDVRPVHRVASFTDSYVNGDTTIAPTTNTGSLKVAQVEFTHQGLCLAGRMFAISAGVVANAKAPIQDLGTTTAAWALWNGNTVASNRYLILDTVGVHLASGTSDIGATLWAGLSPTAQASAVSSATGIVGPKNLAASTTLTSAAIMGGAVTLAGAPAWFPLGGFAPHAAAATPGSGLVVVVGGRICIPPQFACGFTVLSGAGTTAKYAVSATWVEMVLIAG